MRIKQVHGMREKHTIKNCPSCNIFLHPEYNTYEYQYTKDVPIEFENLKLYKRNKRRIKIVEREEKERIEEERKMDRTKNKNKVDMKYCKEKKIKGERKKQRQFKCIVNSNRLKGIIGDIKHKHCFFNQKCHRYPRQRQKNNDRKFHVKPLFNKHDYTTIHDNEENYEDFEWENLKRYAEYIRNLGIKHY